MKTNLIIGSEDLASRILLSRLPAAYSGQRCQDIPCRLSSLRLPRILSYIPVMGLGGQNRKKQFCRFNFQFRNHSRRRQ